MSKVVLHMASGRTLDQHVPAEVDVAELQDLVAETIASGLTINLDQPDGSVFVVNTAHVAYAVVTQ